MTVAIIGAGAMGGAVAEGLLNTRTGQAFAVTVANPHAGKLERFAALGASVTTDNKVAVADADVVIVAVKPWLAEAVLDEIRPMLDAHRQVVVSVAAGVAGARLQTRLQAADGSMPAVFRVMPNIAAAIGASMSFVVPVKATTEQTMRVQRVFDAVGSTKVIDEQHLAAATALSGCGIAYAMRYIRAAAEGGVELGFGADAAKDIVLQTVKGAVELLQTGGNHPEAEIDKVTTPGGLTIKGLNAMERAGFTSAVIDGLKAGV